MSAFLPVGRPDRADDFSDVDIDPFADERPVEQAPSGPALDIVLLADVETRAIDWLWRRWLPLGKLTLLGGHAGDGKSTITAAIAAILSRGEAWPDGEPAPKGRTLFLLAEDALDDTLKPRLVLHHADCTQVLALRAVRDADGKERGFNLARHVDELEAAIVRYGITLLVIDPLSSFLQGADRNGEDVRDIYTPLVQMLDRRHVAAIGIMHVGKPGAGAACRCFWGRRRSEPSPGRHGRWPRHRPTTTRTGACWASSKTTSRCDRQTSRSLATRTGRSAGSARRRTTSSCCYRAGTSARPRRRNARTSSTCWKSIPRA